MTEPILQLQGISKVYPGVIALDDVSMSLAPGEVLGLIGENGAGKSTLLKVLGGVIAPSAGTIRLSGEPHKALSVQQSMAAGIAFVHQELNLFDNLDVASNVFIGRELRKGRLGLVDSAAMAARVQPILDRLGATFGPTTPVLRLSLAERQLLEIAKALSLDARVVIMDEPTSSLTISETNRLLEIVANLKADGISVIFVSHRLGEVEECADRVVVLRDGKVAGELAHDAIEHDAMIRLMIGRDLKALYDPPGIERGAPVLQINGLQTEANPGATVDLDVFAGEIVGLAGLVGAGRTELARAVFGIDQAIQGSIVLDGADLAHHAPGDAIAGGLFLVPEDRKQSGLILEFSIQDNISMPALKSLSRRGLVDRKRETARANAQREALSIKAPDVGRLAMELSGGNQQKIVLAKWLAMEPRAIIFDEPTRGIDVGAKTEIYKLMRGLADHGVAVLMISSDMEEVIGVSDRILVMHNGEIAGELTRDQFSEHNVLTLAVGHTPEGGTVHA